MSHIIPMRDIITMYYYINMSDTGIMCGIIKLNGVKMREGTIKKGATV